MNKQFFRIEYDDLNVLGLTLHDENSVTYSSNKFIIDTLENGKRMLSSLGVDCTLIEVQTGAFIPSIKE